MTYFFISDLHVDSSDGVKYHLSNMQKKGLLKRFGRRKEGDWEVLVDIR